MHLRLDMSYVMGSVRGIEVKARANEQFILFLSPCKNLEGVYTSKENNALHPYISTFRFTSIFVLIIRLFSIVLKLYISILHIRFCLEA